MTIRPKTLELMTFFEYNYHWIIVSCTEASKIIFHTQRIEKSFTYYAAYRYPEGEYQVDNKKTNTIQRIIIIILILIIIAGATVSVIMILGSGKNEENKPSKGVVGVITDSWDPDVSSTADSNGEQQKGIQIPGYSRAEMNEGDTSLKLSVGNPKENSVGFIATVRLGNGTVLYTSPVLKPGQGLEEIPLEKTLPKGTYDAEVYFQCVMLDEEHTPLNSAESGFQLIVN